MPDTSKLEKLNRELEKSEKKLRKAINDEKALQHQLKAAYPKRDGRTGSVPVAVCRKVFCKSRDA